MSVKERILKIYAKHGPMNVTQLRKHVDVAWVAVACAKAARDGALVRLGGGPKSSIYGLPGQTLPKGEAGAVPAKDKKPSAKAPKVQRKTARKAPKPESAAHRLDLANPSLRTACADAQAGDFRAAIASDGAMLFLGASCGAFELSRAETRALVAFVRELDAGTVTAA